MHYRSCSRNVTKLEDSVSRKHEHKTWLCTGNALEIFDRRMRRFFTNTLTRREKVKRHH